MFEFQDEQNVAVQLPTGVVSHSKSDHLGRKVFDELQLGKGLMNRTFTYHKGEVTQAHLDNDKVVSSPETELVKTIEFADGRTIQYEYDAEERITKVTDNVDGTTVYTYDSLGQLLTEVKNNVPINTMMYAPEDDPKKQYGNILKKNGVDYTYDTIWKDKLIKVGTQSITYDAQGNPTSYLGHTLTWEKGRQLKSYDTNTYKYNKDGIRISKTVNGVEHKYVLDGTNIVKETWGSNALVPLYDLDGTVCGINYNGTAYYFYKNLQGDVIAITNDVGTVVAKYVYDAWGKCTVTADTSGVNIATINPFRYRSYYYDIEIELYYLQSRYYDAGVGRFINADDCLEICCQIDFININLYSYCINNPLNGIDNDGYGIATIIAGAAIGGLLGAGCEVLLQLLQGRTFKTLDWWSISIEFLNGALTGGLIGAGLPACVTTQGRAMINSITSLFHSINKRDNFWVAVLKMIGSYLATLIAGSYYMGKGKYVVADTMVKTIVNTIKTRFARFTIRVGFFSVTIVPDKIKSKG